MRGIVRSCRGEKQIIRQMPREIIVESKGIAIFRISCAVRTLVPRTQIATRIVSRQIRAALLLDFPQPWPLRSMWRNQHPLARQRIKPSMRRFLQQRSIIHAFHKRAILGPRFLSGSPSASFPPRFPPTPLPATLRKYKCPAARRSPPDSPPKRALEILQPALRPPD